jgi:hypothetical protein
MVNRDGRREKRMRFETSVTLIRAQEPGVSESALTQNVSPMGTRVLVKSSMAPDQLLYLTSPAVGVRASVRVIYCQPLANGQFAVGLRVQGHPVNWAGFP